MQECNESNINKRHISHAPAVLVGMKMLTVQSHGIWLHI